MNCIMGSVKKANSLYSISLSSVAKWFKSQVQLHIIRKTVSIRKKMVPSPPVKLKSLKNLNKSGHSKIVPTSVNMIKPMQAS